LAIGVIGDGASVFSSVLPGGYQHPWPAKGLTNTSAWLFPIC